MKKLSATVVVLGSLLLLNGCYTVVQYSGDYTYSDNSVNTTIIYEPAPLPPPPPPPPNYPHIPRPVDTPTQPTKDRINDNNGRNSGSSYDSGARDNGGRGNDGRNNTGSRR